MQTSRQQCENNRCDNPLPNAPRITHNRRYCSPRCANNARQQRFKTLRRGYLNCHRCGERNHI